ncbi:MAG: outer membrane lipoprotein chaperone LolA [Sinobacteraceae bacterium]|nr:outer membrane lipoprotein chaperone LolA [Nevskia sp.]MDI3259049.1 outer membrane lipoprotein chaperone LolA [Nevskiaceae bacterium]
MLASLKPATRLALLALAMAATAAHADSAAQTLKRFTEGVRTFEAHFEQVQTDDHGRVIATSSGHFWLQRPASGEGQGKFRWAYEKPYEQLTVCDGVKLWTYDPDLNQATVRDARAALAGTPAELLSQKGALERAFTLEPGEDGAARSVRLIPKSQDSDFKSIELQLAADGAPLAMRFSDHLGGHSEVRFSDIRTNARIDPAQFSFTPPKGAEIVNDGGIATRATD